MARINRIIPFSWWPANWGLAGKRRAEAQAEYYWDGEELAIKLIELRFDEGSPEYHTALLHHKYRYHHIGEFDYGLGLIKHDAKLTSTDREREEAKYLHRFGKISAEELEYKLFDLSYDVKDTESYKNERLKLDVRYGKKTEEEADHERLDWKYQDKNSDDYKLAANDLELKWGNISQDQHDKEEANIKREPWFTLLGADKSIKADNTRLAIELDWNDHFITFLEEQGWTGNSPDEIVDKWFEEAMRQMLRIEMGEEEPEEIEPLPMAGMQKRKRDDGLTEYR